MLTLGWHALTLPPPPKPGALIAAPLPLPTPARLGATERWRIARVAPPPEPPPMGGGSDGPPTPPLRLRVRGRRITIRPTPEFELIDGVQAGTDGSVLVRRAHRGMSWTSRSTILYRGRDEPVPYGSVSIYRDRRNYAGSETEVSAIGSPVSEPQAFLVEDGRHRRMGPGEVQLWDPDGLIVLDIAVDVEDRPASPETATLDGFVGLRYRGRAWDVAGYRFLGRARDGTVVLAAGVSRPTWGGPRRPERHRSTARVLLWRAGRFVAHRALPLDWWVAGMSPSGWILLRRHAEPPSGLERPAGPPLDAERDWTAAILRGDTISPIAFPRPTGSEGLLWRDGASEYGPSAFRFHAFYGETERWYRVSRATGEG